MTLQVSTNQNTSMALGFTYEPITLYLNKITITVPHTFVQIAYAQAAHAKQQSIDTYGFTKGHTPIAYIEKNYRLEIVKIVQEFLLHYFVISYLYKNIVKHGMLVAGNPRLVDILIDDGKDAIFNFELSTFPALSLQSWKNFSFKAPKRKNYKDIDRQVQSFIKDEYNRFKQYSEQDSVIQSGDWVGFDVTIINENNEKFYPNSPEKLWIKIGEEEADSPLRNCFLNKKVGDQFYNQDESFQNYFHQSLDPIYTFCIEITTVIPHAYVCLESFKHSFKLSTKKDLHQKLIEVYSFRNDLSQRRTMASETLRLLLSKHSLKIPNHFLLREQQKVLETVRSNPDYHVYKMQPQFKNYLKKLAEKQIAETVMIDHIAQTEDIVTSTSDLIAYLNLTKRARTKEFIYFPTKSSKTNGQEIPIPAALLHLHCRREKTLNHIIYHLTKK